MWQRSNNKLWCEYDTNGKVVSAKTKAALVKKLAERNYKIENGRTFKECAEAWLDNHKVEGNTTTSYNSHVERAIQRFGNEYIKDITPDEIQSYLDYLGHLGYAKATVHRAKSILNMIFKYAITTKGSIIRINPCSAVTLPKNLPQKRREPPTDDQIIKIRPDGEMGLFAFFLIFTGLRRGELLALRWEDIDRENKIINVNKAIAYENNQPVEKNRTKTQAGMRTVPLIDALEAVLPDKKEGYIFGDGNKPLTHTQFTKRWLNFCREHDLAYPTVTEHVGANKHVYKATKWHASVTPHQFRHQYATYLENAEVGVYGAQKTLGHSSYVITEDTYTHIRAERQKKDVHDKLNAFINKGETTVPTTVPIVER